MSAPLVEVAWLDSRETVTRAELASVCDLTEAELGELMEYGALHALEGGAQLFSAECVPSLRRAGRLRRDFDLDLFAVALLIEYLNHIEMLEQQVRRLRAHLPPHAPPLEREGPQPWHEPHG